MQPSVELKSIIQQLYASETSGDLPNLARQLYSPQAGVLLIGSDPKDWYEDYDAIIHVYEVASAALSRIRVDQIIAYHESSYGWVADRVTAILPNGVEIPVRHTYIFHQENNAWKVVHAHISVGVPDEEIEK